MLNPALQRLAASGGIATEFPTRPKAAPIEGAEDDFGKMLVHALEEVNGAQNDAGAMRDDFMAGKDVDVHTLMISQEKASTAMQLTLAVRNKALEAFQEINRLPV